MISTPAQNLLEKKNSQFSVFMNVVVVKRLDKTKDSLHPNIKSDYRLIHSSK